MKPQESTFLDSLETLDEVRARYADTVEGLRRALALHEEFLDNLDALRVVLAFGESAAAPSKEETLRA